MSPNVRLKVLIVEDELAAAAAMAETLSDAGHDADVAEDGNAGYARASADGYDVLIVDRMLPGRDGLAMIADLRRAGVSTPALMLTAMGSVVDRVAGLEGGADDYLVKPYASAELKARVAALARRSAAAEDALTLRVGDLVLNRLSRTAQRGDTVFELLPLEFRLLEFLARHTGRAVTRAMLLEQVWGFHFDPRTNIVETHLSRLRRKIDLPGRPSLIATIRGAGYVLG